MSMLCRLCLILAACLLGLTPALADTRVALVIGNGAVCQRYAFSQSA